jgi:uncharacterized membrane protein
VKTLIKQLLLLTTITAIVALFFLTLGINIFVSILLGLVTQFICYNGFTYVVSTIAALRIRKIELERIKELTFQLVEVACPCDNKHKQVIPVRLNTNNQYTCNTCKKTIKVYINIDTAVATEPILQTDTQKIIVQTDDNTR